ncbi:MAG: NAD-dependent epimerase/dehydratase family protein [Acidimicrobiales bacterium]|nr:NAD-dependent epimerase/dehydratase family protein [Acidimicrobiales bacterium]
MKVLVTGGSGFIGRNLVRRLVAEGHGVTVADRAPFPWPEPVRVVAGDLRTPGKVIDALEEGTGGVFHLAAATSVLQSRRDPAGVYQDNVAVTAALLERAREVGAPAFVLASTNAVVGDVGEASIDEHSPLRPLTPYGATKAAAEMLCSAYAGSYGMAAGSVRLTNVYGPGMDHKDSVVPRLLRAARGRTSFEVYGDGAQLRDYLHVEDAVDALLLAWRAGLTGPLTAGFGTSVSVNDLIALVREVTGADLSVRYVDAPSGEMPSVLVDTRRATELGFCPRITLAEGLAQTWREIEAGRLSSVLTAHEARAVPG